MNVIINLNKPSGITSHKAVTKIKNLLRVQKAGHTGTLDPTATGVLLVCLNEATKITKFLIDADKQYNARIKLGERTDTYDSEGRVVEKKDISFLTEDELVKTVKLFIGRIKQKPPMYSAVKVSGRPLYKLARKGIEIERPERLVDIYDIKITGIELPYFDLTISCSKGTYIRTLSDDIGMRLGTGAYLVSLVRTRIGFFDIQNSASFDDLMNGKTSFCSMDTALSDLKEIRLDETDYKKAKNGLPIVLNKISGSNKEESPFHPFTEERAEGINEFVKLKSPEGDLFGIGKVNFHIIRIERILNL